MQINTTQENRISFITLQGELDACSSITFDSTLHSVLAGHPERICVDCGQLAYISSAGLGVIVSYLQELQTRSIPLILYAAQPHLVNMLQVLGLDRFIHVSPDRENALLYSGTQNELMGK